MGKIIHLPTNKDNIVAALETILECAKSGEIENFVFAAECADRNVMTGWHNTDVGMRQYLISHMQVDLNYEIVNINLLDEL